jgi:hypothetical protein
MLPLVFLIAFSRDISDVLILREKRDHQTWRLPNFGIKAVLVFLNSIIAELSSRHFDIPNSESPSEFSRGFTGFQFSLSSKCSLDCMQSIVEPLCCDDFRQVPAICQFFWSYPNAQLSLRFVH